MQGKSILFLRGGVGTGKTTLLKKHLGPFVDRAGGFITRLLTDRNTMLGIEILSAREYLSESSKDNALICKFKDGVPRFNYDPMRKYFENSDNALFYIFDEIGGIELLKPEFKEDFKGVMKRDKPLIAVLKSNTKSFLLSKKLGLEAEYSAAYYEFEEMIRSFPEAEIVEHESAGNALSEKALCSFVRENLDAQFI